jgi:hypothetical protein
MSYNIDPEVLRARGVLGANARWAAEPDRTRATAGARQGFLDKLQREAREKLGPAATDEQVAKAADNALKAHYAKMRLNSLLTRQRRAREQAEALAGAILDGDEADAGEPAA